MKPTSPAITPERFDAVLFDLDGVLTDTAKLHAACWQKMFDEFLQKRASQRGEPFRPFDSEIDYQRYVDGKLRNDWGAGQRPAPQCVIGICSLYRFMIERAQKSGGSLYAADTRNRLGPPIP
jgi:phosphoglycolate phosphatase-like HAD superfamily hydrolase